MAIGKEKTRAKAEKKKQRQNLKKKKHKSGSRRKIYEAKGEVMNKQEERNLEEEKRWNPNPIKSLH